MVNDLTRSSEPSHVTDVRDLLENTGVRNTRRGRWRQSISPAKRFQRRLLREALSTTLR